MDLDLESLIKRIQRPSFLTRNKYYIVTLIFIILTIISVSLIFNTPFFKTIDQNILNTKFILITSVVAILPFLIMLKFIKSLTFRKIILIFIITRIGFFLFLTYFEYGVEIHSQEFSLDMVTRILNGDLFTPYSPLIENDLWRFSPPLFMWWYVYQFFAHNLSPFFLRLVSIAFEIGIIYTIFNLFETFPDSKKESQKDILKIGIIFYTFSIFSITFIILYANMQIFAVMMGLFGLTYYFKSKTDSKNLYYCILFLTLSALIEYLAFTLVISVILILIFQKQFDKLVGVILEVLVIFCIVCLPLILNDSPGFLGRTIFHYKVYENSWNTSIWAISNQILDHLPLFLIIGIILYYSYLKCNNLGSLEYFSVILSIGIFFSPIINFWYYLWILPLLSINLLYSFRKYLITNIFFLVSLFLFFLLFAISALLYPSPIDPNYYIAFNQILDYGDAIGLAGAFRIIGLPLFLIGLIYLIYTYTKSKKFIFAILLPFNIFYLINLFIWLGAFLY